jgi:hypothetical protein
LGDSSEFLASLFLSPELFTQPSPFFRRAASGETNLATPPRALPELWHTICKYKK